MPTLIATKVGMTRVFTELGVSIPVTVLQFEDHQVVQVKDEATDGYKAYQIGTKKVSDLNKPEHSHLKKHGIENLYGELFEVSCDDFSRALVSGDTIGVEEYTNDDVQSVDVTGMTKGRGFTGVIKRWGFKTQPASHGNSLSGRVPGSIGSNQDPGRVWKNKKMPGRYGNTQVTVQSLKVVRVDKERSFMLVKGAVPGPQGARVLVSRAVKK